MSYMSYLQPLKILELSHLSCCRYILPRRTTMLSRRKQKDSCRQPCGFSTLKIVKTTHGGSNASSLPWSDLPSQQNARDESIDKIQYVSLSPYPPFSFVHFFSIFSIPWRTWWRRFKLLNTCPRSQCGRYRGSDSREKTQGLVGFWEIKRWDSIWMYLVASRIFIYIYTTSKLNCFSWLGVWSQELDLAKLPRKASLSGLFRGVAFHTSKVWVEV